MLQFILEFLGKLEFLAGLGLALICVAIILSIRRRSRSSVPSKRSEPKPAIKQKMEQMDIQFFSSHTQLGDYSPASDF
ncbi:hypothetical protein CW705_02210 [Candidatus Bathyarchaeota archaeon]|nr:MAG: hypothetical protein CW705_02210 [Candidatus Bathyarchaeota archaeon]